MQNYYILAGIMRLDRIEKLSRRFLSVLLLLALTGCGPTSSPIQATQRPNGLDILAPVQSARSDWSSRAFHADTLPAMIQLGAERFNKDNIAARFSELALDPKQLTIEERTKVRVYFVGENAGLQNTLGVSLDPPDQARTRPRLIFPNTSTNTSLPKTAQRIQQAEGKIDDTVHNPPTPGEPLIPGDFVDLGTVDAGTTLNFFLVSNGARKGTQVFWPDPEANDDGVQHMVAIAMPDSPYLILSFEDLPGGGDRDYSDCVFAVSLSNYNVQALLGQIDPWRRVKQTATTGALLALLIGGPIALLRYWRRQRKRNVEKSMADVWALIDNNEPIRTQAEVNTPNRALERIREARRRSRNTALRKRWSDLEARACERLFDVESAATLYDEEPDSLDTHESAARWVAQTALEYGRMETFDGISGAWSKRDDATENWLCLRADALQEQDRYKESRALLESHTCEGNHEAERLARLARLQVNTAPEEARLSMQRALQVATQDPDIHLHGAQVLAQLGDRPNAGRMVEQALTLDPRDPFILARAGDFYLQHGTIMQALQIWDDGLKPPSTGFLWLRALFWHKVAHPVPIDFEGTARPNGPLRPLIDFVMELSPHRFWDEKSFAPILKRSPILARRQEVFWLRLLEHIRAGEDSKALALLNLSSYGGRSFQPPLERALLRIVSYRKYGFVETPTTREYPSTYEGVHPFFRDLDLWTRNGGVQKHFKSLMQSNDALSAALLAAGWYEAGLRTQYDAHFSQQDHGWYYLEFQKAFQYNGAHNLDWRFRNRTDRRRSKGA